LHSEDFTLKELLALLVQLSILWMTKNKGIWRVGSMLTERNPKYLEKYCFNVSFSNINRTWIAMISNTGHRVEKPVSGT
jgi:hypothetical protein